MSNKTVYLIMRGLGMFIREFKINTFSFITLATLIFVYHIFFVTGMGASGFLSHIAQINTVRAYFNPAIKDHDKIMEKLATVDGVTAVKYYSPKDAKKFVTDNAPHIAGMKSFSEEFFPAFAELTPVNSEDKTLLSNIEKNVSAIKGIDTVSYGKEFMTRFLTISRGAWVFILTITILFAVALSFTIYNTVKLSLYKYKEEIRLYALVGATRPFISLPYIFSAVLQTVTAYAVTSGIFVFIFRIFNGRVLTPAGIDIFYLPNNIYFILSFIIVGIITMVSAMAGILSFLKRVSSINED